MSLQFFVVAQQEKRTIPERQTSDQKISINDQQSTSSLENAPSSKDNAPSTGDDDASSFAEDDIQPSSSSLEWQASPQNPDKGLAGHLTVDDLLLLRPSFDCKCSRCSFV